jgi:hypothetical protein
MVQSLYANDLLLKESPKKTSIEFFKEEITLSVNDSEAVIHGIYFFRNNTEQGGDFPVLFPFYVDSLSLFPHLIRPYIMDSNKVVDIKFRSVEKANSISFTIPLKPKSITTWYFDYSQKIKASRARYIITSTNAWGKPLQEATYKFIAPCGFDNIKTWPGADTSYREGPDMIFLVHLRDFLPQKDMEISWEKN